MMDQYQDGELVTPEIRARYGRLIDDLLGQTPPIVGRREIDTPDSLGVLIAKLEAIVSERWTLARVRHRDYEARTWSGDVGRGVSPADALADLLFEIQGVPIARLAAA